MKDIWIPLITGVLFLGVGIMCLFCPDKIQQFGLVYYSSHKALARLNPFLEWMRKREFIISLKIIGLMAIGVFALVLYVIVKQRLT